MTTKQKQLSKSSKDKIWKDDFSLGDIGPKDKIILAISGGPDSVFLLHQLLLPSIVKIKMLLPNQIVLAHVNYHLRGKDSDGDQKFVEKLAEDLGIKIEVLQAHPADQIKLDNAGNLEELCRKLRYDFFEKLRLKHKAKYVVTAHHLNDQVETYLFNMSRGASLAGFRGISIYDPKRHLLRPLLQLTKKQILQYLKTSKIPFRVDKSNQSLKFSRNIIRQKIVSEFEKINPNFLQTFDQTLHHMAENATIIEYFCEIWCAEHLSPKLIFPLDKFLKEIPEMQKKLISFIYKKIHGQSITTAQVKEIHSILEKNQAGLQKEFGTKTVIATVKSPKTQKRQVVIKRNLK